MMDKKFTGHKKKFAEDFYKSGAWKACSKSYRDAHPLCERCLAEGKTTPSAEAHHKIRLTPQNLGRPEIALCWDNIEALCEDCHKKEHRKKKRWSVDDDGNVLMEDPP